MRFGTEDRFTGYSHLQDRELLPIARSYPSLTETAKQALQEEFSRRGLDFPPPEEREPAQSTGRKLVTVQRFRDLSEAIVARSFLESSGIPAFLCDENLVRLDWQISNFIGGIRLQVDAPDEADAVELLTQPVLSPIPYDGDSHGDAEFTQPRCPVCHSTEISFQGSSRGAALASLYLLSMPLPLGRETWLCDSCGARWEDSPDNV